jgi:diguanylate cyclase (GGDEF)-like protein
MTFRARLTLFFVGIVAAPLLVGVIAAANASRTQAIRDADARLQVAAVTATDDLRLERLRLTRALTPNVALRAFEAPGAAALDELRRARHLDYLLVLHRGEIESSSVDPGVDATASGIADGALRRVAAEHRVYVRRAGGVSVVGGRMWKPELPAELGVDQALVLDGRPASGTAAPFTSSASPVSAGEHRLVCLCRDGAGLLLSTSARSEGLAWFGWPGILLTALALLVLVGLAYVLAGLVASPLSRLAAEASVVARGEPDPEPEIDPGAGREFLQVATTLRSVSAELTGSRGELERTRGRLAATERLTLIDPLTGVWNRRYLERAIREQAKRYGRFGSQFALLVIDIDRFKRINDTLGHAVGDAVLTEVAHTIDGSIRADIDVLARFGGEEFVVVLPETDGPGAFAAAEKIRELMAESKFEDAEGREVSVTVSIGVAACPADGTVGQEVMARADSAMYRAKAAGRNQTKSASRADHPGSDRS